MIDKNSPSSVQAVAGILDYMDYMECSTHNLLFFFSLTSHHNHHRIYFIYLFTSIKQALRHSGTDTQNEIWDI